MLHNAYIEYSTGYLEAYLQRFPLVELRIIRYIILFTTRTTENTHHPKIGPLILYPEFLSFTTL